jgi:oligosaccharide repeat unit polymerase
MGFNSRNISNPYTIFSIAWLLSLLLYSLGWAGIFPKLSSSLLLFLLLTIIIFGITGFFFNKYKRKINIDSNKLLNINCNVLIAINTVVWILNFLYSGIPLLSGLRNDEFGIPTVIVIATSFNCFLAVYCFYIYLHTKKYKYIFFAVYCLLFFVLLFSRGNIIMTLCSMFFLWINVKNPKLNFKKIGTIVIGLCAVMYVFGVAGNYRAINDIASYNKDFDNSYNSKIILLYGDASDSFKNSFIPDEFFWGYIYLTSPLANLQYDINYSSPPFTIHNVALVFIDEVLLDAVSKRVDKFLNRKPQESALIVDQLTVCTTLAGSYTYAGWGGMIFFLLIFFLFPIIYLLFLLNNPLGVISISIICTMFFFSIFDNMFILSGLTTQLIYPIILGFCGKVKLRSSSVTTAN